MRTDRAATSWSRRSTRRLVAGLLWSLFGAGAGAQPASPFLRVDQVGYRPLTQKVAVLRQPVVGFDAPASFTPPATLQVRRLDNTVAYSGPVVAWNGGAVHAASGDRAWWFDFSELREEGTFFVVDPQGVVRSVDFRIDRHAHRDVLRAAVRMYYYQRCGTAKATPFVDPAYADAPCHVGTQQDLDCRSILDPSPSTSRDLSGGWHDAGDYNKYVNFADDALHDLLGSFEQAPTRWPDDTNLPESGDGVPDLLDEIRYELAWMLKMQNPDGSVLHKVSNTNFNAASPPSLDTVVRRYAPATGSATVSACGVFARAAAAFSVAGDSASIAFASTLRSASIAAWNYLVANPTTIPSNYNNSGFVSASAEDSAYDQQMNRLRAAVHLFRVTGDSVYRAYVDANYPQSHLFQWTWAAPWEHIAQDALLAYMEAPGATPATAAAIRAKFLQAMQSGGQQGALFGHADAYRAYLPDQDHVWGSNRAKAQQGWLVGEVLRLGLDPSNAARWREAHQDYAHYFHGLNPTGLTYLTNLAALGAESSVTQMYHAWFGDGTVWDEAGVSPFGPPPGYLVGGPNHQYAPDAAYSGPPISPPESQPPLKSYKDWNTGWPENSWAVTECHIPYQSAYVRLLTPLALGPEVRLGLDVSQAPASPGTLGVTVSGGAPGSFVAVLWGTDLGAFSLVTPTWSVDLGIALGANAIAQLLFTGSIAANGTAAFSVPIPASLTGLQLHLQATESGTSPHPSQSRVATRVLQ